MPHARLTLAASLLVLCASVPAAQCELETQEFSAPDGELGDLFGYRLARAGDVLVVAATSDDDLGIDAGSAFVYERGASGWQLAKKLLASDGTAGDGFAYSLAIDGATAIVGAPQHGGRGQVYVFARDQGGAGNWGELGRFTPATVAAGAQFGFSLAVAGDHLAVGAPYTGLARPGSVYLYRHDPASASGWTLERELTSVLPSTGFSFGHALAFDGERLAVSGATVARLPYPPSFVVHLIERNAGGPDRWSEVRRISSSLAQPDLFGYRVALAGNTLAVAAPTETSLALGAIGALYVFERERGGPDNWGESVRIEGPESALFTPEQVVLAGDWLVAGSPSSTNAGGVFVYSRNVGLESGFGFVTEIQDLPLEPGSAFGQALAVEGDELLVGASGGYVGGPHGEVYAYDLARLARASWRGDSGHRNVDSLSAEAPILGTTTSLFVDLATTGHAHAAVMVCADPQERVLPGGQVLLGRGLLRVVFLHAPRSGLVYSLPANPALCGVRLTLQAAHLDAGRPFVLSNAQDLVLGVRQ
jgi:hypothetical protein